MNLHAGYGLTIASEVHCPELPVGHGRPDLHVVLGAVSCEGPPVPGPPYRFRRADDALFLDIPAVARFAVRAGDEILVDPAPGAPWAVVRAYLLSAVLPASLHQRGWLTLHASGVQTAAGAVLFAAPSGSGKSTLLAALLERGFTMMCDDVGAVALEEGRPVVRPGVPFLRLWDESLRHLGRSVSDLERVVDGVEKYAVPERHRISKASSPLRMVYILEDGPAIAFSDLDGATRFRMLQAHCRTRPRIEGEKLTPAHFALSARVAAVTRMRRVERPFDLAQVGALADRIAEDLRA